MRTPVVSVLSVCPSALAGCGFSPAEVMSSDVHLRVSQPRTAGALSWPTRSRTPNSFEFDFDIARPFADAMTRLDQQASRIVVHHHTYDRSLADIAAMDSAGTGMHSEIAEVGSTGMASDTTNNGDMIVS